MSSWTFACAVGRIGVFAARNAKIGGEIEHALMREERANAPEEPEGQERKARRPRKVLTDGGYGPVSLAEACA